MDTAAEIEKVLQNFDYHKAKDLYLLVGDNSFFKKKLDIYSVSNELLLKQFLAKILADLPPKGRGDPKAEQIPPKQEAKQEVKVLYGEFPPDVKKIDDEWRFLFREASAKQQALAHNGSTNPAADVRLIMENFRLIREHWKAIAYFKKNGTLPPSKAYSFKLPTTYPLLFNRKQTVLRYIRTYTKTKKVDLLERYQAELEQIETELLKFADYEK